MDRRLKLRWGVVYLKSLPDVYVVHTNNPAKHLLCTQTGCVIDRLVFDANKFDPDHIVDVLNEFYELVSV